MNKKIIVYCIFIGLLAATGCAKTAGSDVVTSSKPVVIDDSNTTNQLDGGPVVNTPPTPINENTIAPEDYSGPKGLSIPFSTENVNDSLLYFSPQEAYSIIARWVRPEEIMPITKGYSFYYRLSHVDNQGTDDGYIIYFGEESANDYKDLKEYAVTVLGEVYSVSYERGFPQYHIEYSPPKITFEVDKSILSDPPEGWLDVFKAQQLLVLRMIVYTDCEPLFEKYNEYQLIFVYRGIEQADGTEYYRIDLCTENKQEVLYSYRVSGNGTTLMLIDKASDAWKNIELL